MGYLAIDQYWRVDHSKEMIDFVLHSIPIADEASNSIPELCHLAHQVPVGCVANTEGM